MNKIFGTSLICFLLATILAASALPTMAGRLQSYDGKTGILVLELEDKSVKKFCLTDKTKCEWMGRNTSPGALRKGAKISIQIAGALNASPLKAAKIVDWSNSDKIVAQGAVNAPYHTPVAQYASTAGGGGVPDGAPTMNSTAHQDMAAIAHGGSQNQVQGPNGNNPSPVNNGPAAAYPTNNAGSTTHFTNQGASLTAPLEMMNIDPYSSNPSAAYPQMGANDAGTLMGVDSGDNAGMSGMEAAYGGSVEKVTGRILEASLQQGYVMVQSFEHPNLLRVLLHETANAPMQILVPGQMIEVTGTQTPQGFRATEIKQAGNF
jgi:hypothetical protein